MARNPIVFICFLFVGMALSAQSEADVNISQGGYGLVKTNINLNYDYGWGAVNDAFSARVSYKVLSKKHIILTANARYTSTQVSFHDNDLSNRFNPEEINLNGTHQFGQIGVTSTFKAKLFGKPFMGMIMINSEWSEGGFARVSGISMGLIMLRANANTQFGIGPLVMANTCSKMPAFIIFMYRHKFNEQWFINLYGGMFDIEYTPTMNDLISLGADVDVKAFYFRPHSENLPTKCRFTSTSFRPMIKYKRRIAQNLCFDIQSGITVKMSCRVNDVRSSKEWIDCHQKVAPFLQAGVSYSL